MNTVKYQLQKKLTSVSKLMMGQVYHTVYSVLIVLIISLHQKISLHAAARGGHKDIVRYLVDKKPDIIDMQDKGGVSYRDALLYLFIRLAAIIHFIVSS